MKVKCSFKSFIVETENLMRLSCSLKNIQNITLSEVVEVYFARYVDKLEFHEVYHSFEFCHRNYSFILRYIQ